MGETAVLLEGALDVTVKPIDVLIQKLREVSQSQEHIIAAIHKENEELSSISKSGLIDVFSAASVYQQKLVQLKRDMYTVTERTDRVKQRALKLQQRRLQLRAEEESKIRKQLEQERSLMAVDATEATAAQSHSHHTLSPPSSSVVTVGSMTPVVSPLPSTTSTSSS